MEQRSIRVDHVGAEREPVVVVENFAPDPEGLVAAAEGLPFAPMGEYYPGVRAPVTPAYFEGLAPILTPVMREVFGAKERIGFTRALYSLATTPPAALTPSSSDRATRGFPPRSRSPSVSPISTASPRG